MPVRAGVCAAVGYEALPGIIYWDGVSRYASRHGPPWYMMDGGGGFNRPSITECPFGHVVPDMLAGSLDSA